MNIVFANKNEDVNKLTEYVKTHNVTDVVYFIQGHNECIMHTYKRLIDFFKENNVDKIFVTNRFSLSNDDLGKVLWAEFIFNHKSKICEIDSGIETNDIYFYNLITAGMSLNEYNNGVYKKPLHYCYKDNNRECRGCKACSCKYSGIPFIINFSTGFFDIFMKECIEVKNENIFKYAHEKMESYIQEIQEIIKKEQRKPRFKYIDTLIGKMSPYYLNFELCENIMDLDDEIKDKYECRLKQLEESLNKLINKNIEEMKIQVLDQYIEDKITKEKLKKIMDAIKNITPTVHGLKKCNWEVIEELRRLR